MATVKEKIIGNMRKKNGKRVIIIHLFHLMATVKEKIKGNMRKKTVKE